ncbi:MAG: serine/threonine protein kinase [Chloroflexota bacterium]
MNNLVGNCIGRYQIIEILGQGGMGIVYKALDPNLDRMVAIKVMQSQFLERNDLQNRFRQEAKTIAKLDHPSIIKVFDYDEVDGSFYIVMEYISGGDLQSLMNEYRKSGRWFNLIDVLGFVRQAAFALSHAHQQEVLHRDIKPSNIMLKIGDDETQYGDLGQPVITDFGLAKLRDGGIATMPHEVIGGTPAYMSPEHVQADELDERSDIYSLGIMLYELTVGRRPFPIKNHFDALRYHARVQPPLPREIVSDLNSDVEKLILKTIAKSPEARYLSTRELIEALGSHLAGEPLTQSEATFNLSPAGPEVDTVLWMPQEDAEIPLNLQDRLKEEEVIVQERFSKLTSPKLEAQTEGHVNHGIQGERSNQGVSKPKSLSLKRSWRTYAVNAITATVLIAGLYFLGVRGLYQLGFRFGAVAELVSPTDVPALETQNQSNQVQFTAPVVNTSSSVPKPTRIQTESPAITKVVRATATLISTISVTSVPMPITSTIALSIHIPTAIPTSYVKVNNIGGVNARLGPNTIYSVLAQLENGATYSLLGQNAEGTWLQICCLNDANAWVFANLVKKHNVVKLPIVEEDFSMIPYKTDGTEVRILHPDNQSAHSGEVRFEWEIVNPSLLIQSVLDAETNLYFEIVLLKSDGEKFGMVQSTKKLATIVDLDRLTRNPWQVTRGQTYQWSIRVGQIVDGRFIEIGLVAPTSTIVYTGL